MTELSRALSTVNSHIESFNGNFTGLSRALGKVSLNLKKGITCLLYSLENV